MCPGDLDRMDRVNDVQEIVSLIDDDYVSLQPQSQGLSGACM